MHRALVLLAWFALALLSACARPPELVPPEVLVSPYGGGMRGEPVWAVAPLRNESGTLEVDVLKVSDALVAKTAEVRGMAVLPVNRTIAAMRVLRMNGVNSPDDARRLCDALGADAIIVGTITAYDPYDPPKMGLTLALYPRSAPRTTAVDPAAVASSGREATAAPAATTDNPLSVAQVYLDGANHAVLMDVKRYSEGRHSEGTALGWRRFLASMDDFTEFAAYHAVSKLLNRERLRLVRTEVAIKEGPR
jgi:hypothetical protein